MRKYQETWLNTLRTAIQEGETSKIKEVCYEILDDDTGGTDSLTMTLADVLFSELSKKQ